MSRSSSRETEIYEVGNPDLGMNNQPPTVLENTENPAVANMVTMENVLPSSDAPESQKQMVYIQSQKERIVAKHKLQMAMMEAEFEQRKLDLERSRESEILNLRLNCDLAEMKANSIKEDTTSNVSFVTLSDASRVRDWTESQNKGRNLNADAPTFVPYQSDSSKAVSLMLKLNLLQGIEPSKFSGKPAEFPTFRKQVQDNLEDGLLSDSQKKEFLPKFLVGEALAVMRRVKGCDYYSIVDTLEKRYGHPAKVAADALQGLKGEKLGNYDFVGLMTLSEELQAVSEILTGEYEAEASTLSNMTEIVSRFPNYIANKWQEKCFHMRDHHKPTLSDLSNFITTQALIKNDPSMMYKPIPPKNSKGTARHTTSMTTNIEKNTSPSKSRCLLCHDAHGLWSCDKFSKLTVNERWEYVKVNKLCHCCLNGGHRKTECQFKNYCGCSATGKHHKLLHNSPESQNQFRKEYVKEQTKIEQYATSVAKSKTILLRVGAVKIISPDGRTLTTYGLQDSASRATVISPKASDLLKLRGETENVTVKTIIGNHTEQFQKVNVKLKCAVGNGQVFPVEGLVTNSFNISEKILPHHIDIAKHFGNVCLPDVELKEISVLIGKDVEGAFELFEVRKSKVKNSRLEAQRGPLGWIVTGSIDTNVPEKDCSIHFISPDISSTIEKFWKIDSCGSLKENGMSIQDKRGMDILQTTTTLRKNGHYETGLLWSSDCIQMPDNYFEAEKRFETLKKKFTRDDVYEKLYRKTMDEYISKGYARKLSQEEAAKRSNKTWYLPHFGITNINKPGKLRIVFDAAANMTGTSLNRNLLTGVDQTNSLLGVLLRFRQEKIAISADIESMFHQVGVKEEDQDALRFLWNTDKKTTPEEYVTTVHIFGASDSPCAANYCLRRTALDNKDMFSEQTVNSILNNFYVDDLLKSFSTPELAIDTAHELMEICAKGGFKLTKFLSNDKTASKSIPHEKRVDTILDLDFSETPPIRALGVSWKVHSDTFCFNIQKFKTNNLETMRGALSTICGIYDPFGMAAPYVFRAKLIVQELWRRKSKWDDPLPGDIIKPWRQWLSDLDSLSTIDVPRCFFSYEKHLSDVQLHHFCDASEQGYAAVSYLRVRYPNGHTEIKFILGKSRNAPLKSLSIPRLELQGAVLASKLEVSIRAELKLDIGKSYFWTDSMITLHYIRNETKRFKIFVSNRVTEIRENSNPEQWRHVPGIMNPADECTRGNQTYRFELGNWLKGPSFLLLQEKEWPEPFLEDLPIENFEIKKEVSLNFVETDTFSELIDRNSKFNTLINSVAWLMKFLDWLKTPKGDRSLMNRTVTLEDIQKAKRRVILFEQNRFYHDEIQALKAFTSVKVSSTIVKLKPILINGLLCVGGRIVRAPISECAIHPIILPKKSHLTEILIRQVHMNHGHCGHEQVLAILRENYWIVRARSPIRSVLQSCLTCKKYLSKPLTQQMADLPKSRLTPYETPFTYCGVDYFGPMMVKRGRGKVREKRWGVIFVCFNSRAVHLDLAKSLDTDDFILVLIRFLNRRGYVKEIRSDNGTNFVGAEKEIRAALCKLNKNKINKTLAQHECKWIFQTPTASHTSGVWERMVKIVKRSLKTIVGNEPYNEEILFTVFTEVERITNNRPLTKNPLSTNDLEALTPNHFLNLRPSMLLPSEIVHENDRFSRKRWRQVQILSNHYWKRWLKEYIPTLQERQKWYKPSRNLKINDLVLVVDDTAPRNLWPLGLVIHVYPGLDGLIRTVDVRTKNGTYKRPINKLCLLEAFDSDM